MSGQTARQQTTPAQIGVAERRREALLLRKAGATYEEIARTVGYPSKGNACRAVKAAIRELTQEPAQEVLALELERLNDMQRGLWLDATRGRVQSVDRVLAIMRQRAVYLGLDKPGTDRDISAVEQWLKHMAGGDLTPDPEPHPYDDATPVPDVPPQ